MTDSVLKKVISNQEQQQKQLDRLNSSMQTVAEAINKLAVMDEKIANDRALAKKHGERLEEHAKRIWALEMRSAENNWIYSIWGTVTSKALTTFIVAVISAALYYAGGK